MLGLLRARHLRGSPACHDEPHVVRHNDPEFVDLSNPTLRHPKKMGYRDKGSRRLEMPREPGSAKGDTTTQDLLTQIFPKTVLPQSLRLVSQASNQPQNLLVSKTQGNQDDQNQPLDLCWCRICLYLHLDRLFSRARYMRFQ